MTAMALRSFLDAPQGQMLRMSEHHQAALFLHEGRLWVADFVDGRGELMDPVDWVRFHCAPARIDAAQRRMLKEAALPLPADLAARIEALLPAASAGSGCADKGPAPAG